MFASACADPLLGVLKFACVVKNNVENWTNTSFIKFRDLFYSYRSHLEKLLKSAFLLRVSHLWSLHNVQISVPCTSIHVPNVFCFVFCLYFLMLMFFRVCLTLTFLIFVVYSWYFKIWLPSNLLLLKGLVFLWSVIPLGGLSRWGRCRYEGISRVWSKFHGLLISVIQKHWWKKR